MKEPIQMDAQAKSEEASAYTIQISGSGVNVQQTVSKEIAAQVIQFILAGDRPAISTNISAARPSVSPGGESNPRVSLTEYLDEINAKRIPERILGMAVFLTEVSHQLPNRTFTRADIKPCFKIAGDPLPANFARDWNLVMGAGWIAQEHGNPDAFFVTRRGLAAVDSKFSTEAERVKRIRRRQRESWTDEMPASSENVDTSDSA